MESVHQHSINTQHNSNSTSQHQKTNYGNIKIFCLQQHAESATTFSLKKTAGQLLDETFLVLRRDLKSLENVDNDLKTKVEKISEDIKTLKLIHGKCAPCHSIKTTDKYCDCTNHPPMKDCLEFKNAGFKVRITFVEIIIFCFV